MVMFKQSVVILFLACVAASSVSCVTAEVEPPKVGSALDLRVKDIDGKDVDLARYKGQVVLVVNVASKCGFVSQYATLQALYEEHKGKGLAVLGFPANNFLRQEPGTDGEIKSFCSENYGVTFDMFSKVSVKGEDMAPLYAFLTSRETNPEFGGPIEWNFTKFLLDHEGKVVARFGARAKPDSEEVVMAVQEALAARPAGTPLYAPVGKKDESFLKLR